MTQLETNALATQAVNVMNRALAQHRDAAPYKQLLAASERLLGGKNLGMAVYADDPKHPYDYYTLHFADGRLELLGRGKQEPDIAWKVSRDYLRRVVDDPERYLAHPEKLDWDWLKDRLGL
jgi:hypothetical protein